MMIFNTIYLGLVCLISHLSPSGVAETQHASEIATPPPSIVVAMPTTGRLLFQIPAVEVLGCENKNDFADTDTVVDGITDPLDALELSTEDGEIHTPVTPAFDFPVVEARLNKAEAEEAPATRVYYPMDPPDHIPPVRDCLHEGTRRRLLLQLPSDPLEAVWAVDKVALYSFVRDPEATHTVTWKSDYDWQPAESLVLPLTPKGRVLFRMPTSPALVDSVVEHVLLTFLEDHHEVAEVIAYGDYDDYKQAGYYDYDDYEQADDATLDEDPKSATAINGGDADDSNSNTEEPTAQADETCGDDHSGNATESTRLETLRNAISRIAVICLIWFFSTWDGFLTSKRDFSSEKEEQPAPQPRQVKIQPFWDPAVKPVESKPRPF